MGRLDVERVPYEDYSNRQLAAVPLAILAVALVIIAVAFVMTGTPVDLGMAFTGGTEVRFTASGESLGDVKASFSSIETTSIRGVGSGDSYLLTTQNAEVSEIEQLAEDAGYTVQSVSERSASFGADTQRQAILGMLVAFVGMSLLVALMFRTFVPSLAIVLSAFSDLMIPIALMNVLNATGIAFLEIELSLGAVAALLMLIGYSVDSDILLNNHILRRRGDFYESTYRAMRTGISMTLTSIAAMATMFLVARLFAIPLLDDVALILVFGLTADLMNTYMMNMSLLRWYKFEGVKQ